MTQGGWFNFPPSPATPWRPQRRLHHLPCSAHPSSKHEGKRMAGSGLACSSRSSDLAGVSAQMRSTCLTLGRLARLTHLASPWLCPGGQRELE
ncbi:unnamed protein product, partial [Gulo gulo]